MRVQCLSGFRDRILTILKDIGLLNTIHRGSTNANKISTICTYWFCWQPRSR
nr:MAG TPA: hypothetical protein [Bacteriophage sp.]